MGADHVRVIDGAFFWPTFNELLYNDDNNLHMGRQWPDDVEHLEKCFKHWAWRFPAFAHMPTHACGTLATASHPGSR